MAVSLNVIQPFLTKNDLLSVYRGNRFKLAGFDVEGVGAAGHNFAYERTFADNIVANDIIRSEVESGAVKDKLPVFA